MLDVYIYIHILSLEQFNLKDIGSAIRTICKCITSNAIWLSDGSKILINQCMTEIYAVLIQFRRLVNNQSPTITYVQCIQTIFVIVFQLMGPIIFFFFFYIIHIASRLRLPTLDYGWCSYLLCGVLKQ